MGRMTAERIDRPDGSILVRPANRSATIRQRLSSDCAITRVETPDRVFLADRVDGGEWRRLTYGDAWRKARAFAAYLLGIDASAERPVVILSGNSIEHGIVALGCFIAGVPYAPISPPYSLVSRDFGKLRHIVSLLTPRLFFVADAAAFAPALNAVMKDDAELLVARNATRRASRSAFRRCAEG